MREHGREEPEEAQCKVRYKQGLKDGRNFDNDGGKGMLGRGDKNKGKGRRKALSRDVSGEWQIIWSDRDTKTNWKGKLVTSGRVLNVSINSDFTVDMAD